MTTKHKKTTLISIGFIIAYSIGSIGFLVPSLRPMFQELTPIILMTSIIVLLSFHKHWRKRDIIILCIIYLFGFLIELIGVQTGKIFGSYQYGDGLGVKLYGTPLIIGVNWVLLSYCSTTISDKLITNRFFKIFLATCLMIIYDLILETVAPFMDMWRFEAGVVPFQNYAIWFIVAFIFNTVLTLSNIKGNYKLCIAIFSIQMGFFGIISIISNFIL
ncbi:MAG TPA: carotenoid biosynthesis protein [Bacteroidales bacterium]|nr:carotenoid biosynthesis protein [Bacteroidales bacterium]